jgi:hypothetical protein
VLRAAHAAHEPLEPSGGVERGELEGAVPSQRGVESRLTVPAEHRGAGRVVRLLVQGRLAGGDVDPEHVEEQRPLVHQHAA